MLSALGLHRASITQSTAEYRAKLPKDATAQTDIVASAPEITTVYSNPKEPGGHSGCWVPGALVDCHCV